MYMLQYLLSGSCKVLAEIKFLDPDWGEKVYSGIG